MRSGFASLTFVCSTISLALGQTPAEHAPAFEIASVKASPAIAGRDGNIEMEPGKFVARNTTLQRLVFEAWQVPYAQIKGGPGWFPTAEYDIQAKAGGPASRDELRLMLRTLLVERFNLTVRREKREGRVYALTVGSKGPKLNGQREGDSPHGWRFHGDLSEFANILAIQLTIPLLEDPHTPSRATGSPVPVINRTGIEGTFDFRLDIRPDAGSDMFAVWQRALQEQLGLRLEAQKADIDMLVIEHVDRVPTSN